MEENENKLVSFEAILKTYKPNKTSSLYEVGDKRNPILPPKEFKPQDVITAVSRQLRDMQKADCVKKRRVTFTKKPETEFIPVDVLKKQEASGQQHTHRFETQCVSDTQLIDIVDTVEAMVDGNRAMSEEFNTTFCHKHDDLENKVTAEEDNTRIHVVDINTVSADSNKGLTEYKQLSNPHAHSIDLKLKVLDNKEEDVYDDINEINTEICREFDISYCRTQNNNFTSNNKERTDINVDVTDVNDINVDEKAVHCVQKTTADETNESSSKKESKNKYDVSNENNIIHSNIPNPEAVKDHKSYDNLETKYAEIEKKDSEVLNINIKDDFLDTVKINNAEEEELICSPVLQNFKSRRKSPSPLVYALDFFEKFESLAMPIIEDNVDLETAKHLINSQIMNMELVIETNASPVLNKPKSNSMLEVDECNKDVSEVDHSKDCKVSETKNKSKHIPVLVVNENKETTKNVQEVNQSQDESVNKPENISRLEEDEILFSSDEESDMNRVDNLPSTCASKTSSFATEVFDFEKVMYVGFQTGSNKTIQVCRDSFDKAKSIFENINKLNEENLTITELVDIYDSNISNVNNNNLISKEFSTDVNDPSNRAKIEISSKNSCSKMEPKEETDEVLNNTEKVLNDMEGALHPETNKNRKRDFAGFKTASNKRIKLSDDALAKSAIVFKDIDLNFNFNPENTHSKITDANEEVYIQCFESVAEETDVLYNKENIDEEDHLNVIDQSLMQEFENESIEETKKHDYFENAPYKCAGLRISSEISEVALKISKNILNNAESYIKNDVKVNFDPGIDENIKNINDMQTLPNVPNFVGFKTANNKDIKISEEALAKTRSIFQDLGFDDISDKNDKNVKPNNEESIKSLLNNNFVKQNTLEMNKECNSVNIAQPKKSSSLTAVTRSGTDVFPKESSTLSCNKNEKNPYPSIYEGKNIDTVSNHEDNSHKDKNSPAIFQGFKTANNKTVKVSDEAILKSKNVFQDIANIVPCRDYLEIKSNALINNPSRFEGFKTASNKRVKVSEEALAKTRKVFHDIDINNDINEEHESNICGIDNKEMNHGNNKISNIKDDKIYLKARLGRKTGDNDIAQITTQCLNDKRNSFQGFKTAGNKPVKVSEDALLKSKMIFKDIDNLSNDNLFTTSDGLKNCAQNFVENSDDNIIRNQAKFQGFKTASNKIMNISEKALAISKNIFKDIDFEQDIPNNIVEKYDDIETVSEKPIVDIDRGKNKDLKMFNGFQTANNKSANVSDEALARSRKIFKELDLDLVNTKDNMIVDDIEDTNKEKANVLKNMEMPPVFGFKTATNKPIKISEDALKKSKQLFAELDNLTQQNIDTKEISKIPAKNEERDEVNVDNILNTQVLNNFEETLYTEDFQKDFTPKQCKRSGSPILSCPKAKKRKKFETPYRNDMNTIKIPKIVCNTKENTDLKYIFSENYKKTKLYSLKDVHNIDRGNEDDLNIDPYILKFNFDTFLNFEFPGARNELTDTKWSTDDIKRCFTESVNKKIIPDGWIDNHLRLILWKLISYELRFPKTLKGVCSVKNVLEQLKYRYDKELYNVQRPALRKLLEKDDIATRTMVLAVLGIYVDNVRVDRVTNLHTTPELLLTDGWYCIKTCIDAMLANLVTNGRITVGMKIATVGAELMGCEQGISPWEDTSTVRLKIFGNSTRPARWDAKLGYHATGAMLSHLSSVKLTGGKVCKLRVFVARVYPALYVQRFEDGSTVTRSERLENLHQMKYETERQLQLEKLYEEVEKEFFEQESSGSEGGDLDLKKSLQSGSQLHKNMMRSRDPNEFRSNLTHSQSTRLDSYTSRRHEKVLEALQRRVQERVQRAGLHAGRNVVPLLKIRVVGEGRADVAVSKAMISIWRPSDAIFDVVKEGTWVDVFNIVPTAIRNSEIQISAGRQSVFHRSKHKDNEKLKPHIESFTRKCFTTKELAKNPTITTDFNEIDTAGIVFLIEPSTTDFETSKSLFQNVYLTDIDKNFVCVNFWGGIKKFGYENIFDTGHTVACMNLQKRAGNTRKSIPQYRATEFSVFTKSPKLENVRIIYEDLVKQLYGLDKRKFCDDCVLLKNNYASLRQAAENISPYRFNTSDHNITKNKMFIDSPLAQKDANLNLTGLDFESTFKQTDTQELSPARLQQKRRVNEKINRLKMYGEPPPLSKMHIINKSKNAGSAYKSPLTSDVSNVARLKILNDSPVTTNSKRQSSPILPMNTTYVLKPGVNPVKLNFSTISGDDGNNVINPFAEDFESSPPLSLDCDQV